MGEIKIFRASAGSGKTHRLTQEYLNLLKEDDRAYRRILAVTFTNKATEEMKRRVVERLFAESTAGDNLSSKLLRNILHDYSLFNITTIDKFFQKTLRAFAREIGRNTSYELELNNSNILTQAIDRMLFSLDSEENETLLNWILELSIQRIDDGKSWDVRSIIQVTAEQLFKEAYKIAVKHEGDWFLDKQHISSYTSVIQKVITDYESVLSMYGKSGCEILRSAGLKPEEFSRKSSSFARRFAKLAKGEFTLSNETFKTASQSSDTWFSKSALKEDPTLSERGAVAERMNLQSLMCEIIKYESDHYIDYATAQAISKNIFTLGLVSDIKKNIKEVTDDSGVILLSETSELLNDIIDGSDTPFIFEKTGTRTDHYMLDEFQDTSVMQWENFKPLLKNSISSGYSNLIVGDEKQSIYRWRGSDWTLLNKSVFEEFHKDEINYSPLTDNWRSGKEIVDFINDFFPKAASVCDDILEHSYDEDAKVTSIYSSVCQSMPAEKIIRKGYVELKFVSEKGEDYNNSALEFVRSSIDRVIANGGHLSDIAVLVRRNSEGSLVAENLIDAGIRVISGDSLFLANSDSVSAMIANLRYISNPKDDINNVLVKFSGINIADIDKVSTLPLYEMCESLAEYLPEELKRAEAAFIFSFLDTVRDYIKVNRADLSAFLSWWKENSQRLTIPAPEGEEAVRVITIHKAKGLGYSTVIVPFTEFGFKGLSDIIWCKPNTPPFNKMPIVPVLKADALTSTHFKADYEKESFLRIVDNLNMAYVAFTRAKDNLFILVNETDKPDRMPKGVGEIISHFYSDLSGDKKVLKFGEEIVIPELKSNSIEGRVMPLFKSWDNSDNLRLTLRSEEFFNPEESSRSRGVVIHSILSQIYFVKDIKSAVQNAVNSGELEAKYTEETENYFTNLINSVEHLGWFSSESKILNECEILLPSGKVYRPDRVILGDTLTVVDFKTGKLKSKGHIRQLMDYISSLKEMGMNNIKGYLWYLDENEVIEVV